MKKYIFSIIAVAVMALTSCTNRDPEGLTRVTTYAVITLEGGNSIQVDKGTSFVDPGYSADLGGEDVTKELMIESNVNTAKSGVYSITYTYVNADGFAASAVRKVVVLDPNSPIEGFYTTDANSYRLYNGAQTAYKGAYQSLIIDNGDGTVSIDDVLAGWYGQRAGYGASYYMAADLSVDADGNIDLIDSYIPGWGDGLEDFADGKFDAATGDITYVATYVSGMEFHVTLHKNSK
ncbi:MAG: DUF5012 domain-containing protein [Bacteroidales bacterium]|nr:DUF5012 domain-containing protein [Bacteroidales bacterium]